METVNIAKLLVIKKFRPRKKIRTGRGRIVTLETVGTVGSDFPADEAVLMLLGVKIIQGSLEREETVPVAGEHHHEGVVPHEYIPVVSDIQIGRHETGSLLRLTDIPDSDLPGMPVHLDFFLVAFPIWRWKNLLGLLERLGGLGHRLHRTESVLRDKDILHVSILVRKVVRAGLQVLGQCGGGAAKHQRQRQ